MSGEQGCSEDARARLSLRMGSTSHLELRVLREGVCTSITGERVVIGVPESLLLYDVAVSGLAEALAGLLLAKPLEEDDPEGVIAGARRLYVARVARLEARRLSKRLGLLGEHALVADIWPLVSRMARLQRLHPWLRAAYSYTVDSKGEGFRWLRGLARDAYAERLFEPLPGLLERVEAQPSRPQRPGLGRVLREALPLRGFSLGSLPLQAFMEGVLARSPPLLRDPLLLVRLDSARLATRLLRFEEQLYAIIGVSRALRRRVSPIRSVSVVEAADFTPAVVKHYRDISSAKWVLVAAAAPGYPKPRTSPSRRLQAEYHYNRVLASKGFRVPDPILVDVRRLKAAYRFIEGRTLAELLSENPLHPLYSRLGSLLARLHGEAGVALWDSNPTNIVASGDELYLVDLEQARQASRPRVMAADIAVAVYYSIPYAVSSAAERAAALAKAYIDSGGSPDVVLEASRYRYAAPFFTIAPVNVVEKARRALAYTALQAMGRDGRLLGAPM